MTSVIRNCKLSAFTLVEVLVVITISCFFVVMVYAAVHFFVTAAIKAKVTQQGAQSLWTLEGNLMHEADAARILFGSITDSLLFCYMTSGDTIKYSFSRRYIIRMQRNRTDTFTTMCTGLHFGFKQRSIETGIIDYFDIKTEYKQSDQPLTFYKRYTPEEFSNLIDTIHKTNP